SPKPRVRASRASSSAAGDRLPRRRAPPVRSRNGNRRQLRAARFPDRHTRFRRAAAPPRFRALAPAAVWPTARSKALRRQRRAALRRAAAAPARPLPAARLRRPKARPGARSRRRPRKETDVVKGLFLFEGEPPPFDELQHGKKGYDNHVAGHSQLPAKLRKARLTTFLDAAHYVVHRGHQRDAFAGDGALLRTGLAQHLHESTLEFFRVDVVALDHLAGGVARLAV